jgi:hypothetical protein
VPDVILAQTLARPRALWPLLWLSATAGAVLLAVSYSMAATRGADQGHYAVFWAGMLVFTVPTVAVAGSRRVSDRLRLGWLAAYALFTYLPKLLRNPGGPLYHDEIAHWRQTVGIATTGHLFEPNATIGIISRFPGLHIVVATISGSTGLSVWQSALLVLVLAHVLTVLGAAVLGESLFGSVRAGMVVALIYSLNSSFLYFDTQFAYESLAIPLFVWCLAALAKAHNTTERGERLGWTVTAAVIGGMTVTVHHLTALILVLVLVVVTAVTAFMARRGRVPWHTVWDTLAVLVVTGGIAGAWIVLVAPQTISYLSPYLGGGLSQLFHLFAGSGGGRTLFSASTEPGYERVFAFAAPVIIGLLALKVVVPQLRRAKREHWSAMRLGLGGFGLVYFPSVLFILIQSGAEGARRSWAFTYLGLAVLLAPAVLAIWDRVRWPDLGRTITSYVAAFALWATMLVGNVAAGLDESYRFPGPFIFGSDTRSLTPELLAAASWFDQHVGSGVRIVTDRYSGLGFVLDADSWTASPSAGFPAYDLFFSDKPPSAALVEELASSDYRYLIVDKRVATEIPAIGSYFEPDEPFAGASAHPIPAGNIDRYQTTPWTTKVFESDHYVIYRFDFNAIGVQP